MRSLGKDNGIFLDSLLTINGMLYAFKFNKHLIIMYDVEGQVTCDWSK